MARKQRGATLTGKAKSLILKLEEAVDGEDAALTLHIYGRVCNLVGKSTVDSALSDNVRQNIKTAHNNMYRPTPMPVT